MALKSVDIIDRGIAEAFLGLAPHVCNMALSGDTRHLALARSHQLLLMPQQFAAIEGPLLVPLPAGAEVCRLCWLWADEEFILIVGSSSGHVCAFTPAGAHLGTRLPEVEAGLELPSAVLQLETQFTDGEPELLCLFEGGSVLCTSARALREGGKIAVYDLPPSHRQEEAHQCRAIVCCGVMSPLPLDLTPTPSAAARLPVRPRGCSHYSEVSLVFVSTQHSSLSLLTIEGSTPTSAVVATLADVAAPATEGSRISRGLAFRPSSTICSCCPRALLSAVDRGYGQSRACHTAGSAFACRAPRVEGLPRCSVRLDGFVGYRWLLGRWPSRGAVASIIRPPSRAPRSVASAPWQPVARRWQARRQLRAACATAAVPESPCSCWRW